ncbi:MAG: DUF1343 domain-containing protein [Chitinophagales bacterium]|nr:DUF1343 domain-containing protein [Chitinophagales bacterium]
MKGFLSVACFICLLLFNNCLGQKQNKINQPSTTVAEVTGVITGAENTAMYFDSLKGKNVALMVNHTSLVGGKHLVDTLLKSNIRIVKIFAPEHGFRGTADAGEKISDTVDPKTGIPIVSLYGKKLKPDSADLSGVDVVVFDIQDVGVRCFTYVSSLYYLLEACAEQQVPVIILDRPNPNIHRVDGPLPKKSFRNFVALLPVPLLYGLTIGELATMIVGERWIDLPVQPRLTVIPCKNYTRQTRYSLPVRPSPNLPNDRAIYLYPSLVFFEGCNVSVGRGTEFPFQVFGAPDWDFAPFRFTPQSMPGAKEPPFLNTLCKGYDLRKPVSDFGEEGDKINLMYLIKAYEKSNNKENFFLKNGFLNKLAGYDLKTQIETELSEEEIRNSWQKNLYHFKTIREKYFIYPNN